MKRSVLFYTAIIVALCSAAGCTYNLAPQLHGSWAMKYRETGYYLWDIQNETWTIDSLGTVCFPDSRPDSCATFTTQRRKLLLEGPVPEDYSSRTYKVKKVSEEELILRSEEPHAGKVTAFYYYFIKDD